MTALNELPTTVTSADEDLLLVQQGGGDRQISKGDLLTTTTSTGSQPLAGALDDRVVRVGSVAGLADVTPADNLQFSVGEFWPDTGKGGGVFTWDASRSKADHNGGTVIDPDKLTQLGTIGVFGTYFTAAATGTGCFVSTNENEDLDAGAFGLVETGDLSVIISGLATNFSTKGFHLKIPFNEVSFLSALPALENVTLSGMGINKTRLTKKFDGNLCTSFGDYSRLEHLYVFGENRPGELFIMPAGTASQSIDRVRMTSTPEKMVVFENLGGVKARISNSDIGNTSSTIAAIASRGGYQESSAATRHFTNNETAGGILYDVSGMNDTYITGGYTQGFIFDDLCSKVFINNMRWGVAAAPAPQSYDIRGENLGITNITCSVPIGENVNLYCTDSRIDIVASRWAIRDLGSGNSVEIKEQAYTPAWTATGVNQPIVGDGAIRGQWCRNGNNITVQIDLQFGSTTDAGQGEWRFALPPDTSVKPWDGPTTYSGSGVTLNSGGEEYHLIAEIQPPPAFSDTVALRAIDAAGARVVIGGVTKVWSSSTAVRFIFSFKTL